MARFVLPQALFQEREMNFSGISSHALKYIDGNKSLEYERHVDYSTTFFRISYLGKAATT